MADQPLHECELVGVFFRVGRIAVGQIDAGEPDHAAVRRDDRLDVARLGVGVVARQAARDLERALRQDRDAVERLLPVRLDIVAERLDLEPRELLVEALDLLQAERVGRGLLQIVAEMADPLADGIDVPGGDAQGGLGSFAAIVARAALEGRARRRLQTLPSRLGQRSPSLAPGSSPKTPHTRGDKGYSLRRPPPEIREQAATEFVRASSNDRAAEGRGQSSIA